MSNRPFEEHSIIGDKRSFVFHNLANETEECGIDAIVEAEATQLFGPDDPSEARNRGYKAHGACDRAAQEAGAA